MKTGERATRSADGRTLTIHRRFANDPYLKKAEQMREQGTGMTGENRLAGIVPMHLLAEWIKVAGLTWEDTDAVKDLVRRKMLSGDFDKLRVWQGRY